MALPSILILPPIKWEFSQEAKIQTQNTKLGDGYGLISLVPNSTRITTELVIPNLNTVTKDYIISTFTEYGGITTFRWRPLESLPYKEYICDKWSVIQQGTYLWQITATFTEQKTAGNATIYVPIIEDGSITTAKIADGAVTRSKLSASIQANILNYGNYIINSDFRIAQAATTATITAGNAVPTASLGYPVFDCWFVYCLGSNGTLSRIAQTATSSARLQLTTLANSTGAGVGQRIESLNSINLAGKIVTLSFSCSHTNLTSLAVTASNPSFNKDRFGTIALSQKTTVASTTIAITSTLTRYTWTFFCPQSVDKGLEILFTFGSNASAGTFQLANVKLEEDYPATAFIPTDYGTELRKCQRQYARMPATRYGFPSPSTGGYQYIQRYDFPTTMRAIPVVTKVYSATSNTSSFSTLDTTLDFFTDRVTATTAGNAAWTLAAEYFAYIP